MAAKTNLQRDLNLNLKLINLVGVLCAIQSTCCLGFSTASARCRCLAGSRCFPGPDTWAAFNGSINGRLLDVRPTAYPCYSPQYAAQCSAARANWGNAAWRAEQVGAAEHPNWEAAGSDECPMPDANLTSPSSLSSSSSSSSSCKQGSVPVYAVNASTADEISTAVRFAARHRLRLVVKNTGHDYLGRSFAKGSLSIWTHSMKGIDFVDDFQEDGCSDSAAGQPAVRVGAGVQWRELYRAAHEYNRVVVGALSASVGAAGGYVQGGGHSPLGPTYGMAADNVLQYDVVAANGTAVTVNRCRGADLFWALRGGGGGTFGVVTAAVYRTHPAPSSVLSAQYVLAAADADSYRDMVAQFTAMHTSLSALGWAGYFNLAGTYLVIRYLVLNQTASYASTSFQILTDYISDHSTTVTPLVSNITSFPSFLDWYDDALCSFYPDNPNCTDEVGVNRALVTRLIPESIIQTSPGLVAESLIRLQLADGLSGRVLGISVGGGAVAVPRDNAVNPAWRSALWHVTAEATWNDTTPWSTVRRTLRRITDANAVLRQITPGSGAYVNEADYNEPDWQQSLFGDNYDRLLSIKRDVDPDGLFVCRHCVGSDDWTDSLNCPKS